MSSAHIIQDQPTADKPALGFPPSPEAIAAARSLLRERVDWDCPERQDVLEKCIGKMPTPFFEAGLKYVLENMEIGLDTNIYDLIYEQDVENYRVLKNNSDDGELTAEAQAEYRAQCAALRAEADLLRAAPRLETLNDVKDAVGVVVRDHDRRQKCNEFQWTLEDICACHAAGDIEGANACLRAWLQRTESVEKIAPFNWRELASQSLSWAFASTIPAGCASLIAGRSAAGKTSLAIGLCLSAAAGTPIFEAFHPSGPAPALFVSTEDPPVILGAKVNEYVGYFAIDGDALQNLDSNLHILCNAPPLLDSKGETTPAYDEILAWARAARPSLIVLDHFRGLSGVMDENASAATGAALRAFNRLGAESGAAVLILHHVNKAQSAAPGRNMIRGSSAIESESRAVFLIVPEGGAGFRLINDKNAYGPRVADSVYTLEHGIAIPGGDTKNQAALETAILEWILANTNLRVNPQTIATCKAGAGLQLCRDIAHALHWATRQEIADTVQALIRAGVLQEEAAWHKGNKTSRITIAPDYEEDLLNV